MRRIQLLLAVVLVTVPLAGCTDTFSNLARDVSGQPSNVWALELSGITQLHDEGLTGQNVVVAVIDTGIHASHSEFSDVFIRWLDLVNGRKDPYDDRGHGTHVAGMVVAQGAGGNFDPQVVGAAPGAQLLAIKAIAGDGEGSGETVARAIDRAVQEGAHVIVLSLGGAPRVLPLGDEVRNSVDRAIDRGVVVVAAAGNAPDGQTGNDCTVRSPANVPGVIAVGAVDKDKRIGDFSCHGENQGTLGTNVGAPQDPNKKPEIVAAGVALVGPWADRPCGAQGPASPYCMATGTSQAVPIVGGAVALILEAHPELKRQDRDTVRQIKEALVRTAEEIGPLGPNDQHDDRYGYGLLRADLAIQRF